MRVLRWILHHCVAQDDTRVAMVAAFVVRDAVY